MGKYTRRLPNAITLMRPVLACVFIAMLPGYMSGEIGAAFPLAVFGGICLTDFADGRLARMLGAATETGAYLDLYSDFFYIAASLVTLNVLGQMPVWFTAVVLIKFSEYVVTSRLMRRGRAVFVTDPFGRVAAGLFFIIPGLVCVLYGVRDGSLIVGCVLYLAAALSLLSSITRCMSCVRIMKRGAIHGH